ncbi:CDP-diacylglycerol--glycerol-3-phosphate 3-phosphatidyltransferase [Profundibacter sp.]|uniref:CDP-diacylglycerol--glycerol-3-phosphate 3-phosphatidyltransferase n=1 Tax=Profundibacter sp. TaxID=3101071 RepID=UPI003D14B57D
MTWNVPNILTVIRLLAAPALAVMFLYFNTPWADWFALILFVTAALTDFVDGYLARAWKQESKFGAMLDPIADKAMVLIALLVIIGFSGVKPWILLPATMIFFREVFVSGLREYLGDKASKLKVTKLAKWKTTAQMIAIAVLFSQGIFADRFVELTQAMDPQMIDAIITGQQEDLNGLLWVQKGANASYYGGIALLWIAAGLTLITGWDYFVKALPFLKDDTK